MLSRPPMPALRALLFAGPLVLALPLVAEAQMTLTVTNVSDRAAGTTLDLNTLAVSARVSLPAKPEGVAVGAEGRVLISTIGTGAGNIANVLLVYDPAAQATSSLTSVPVAPPPPQSPLLPAPSGRIFLSSRSQLQATPDGSLIVGVIGALLGGWLFGLVGISLPGHPLLWQLIAATVGAILFLFLLRFIK